MAVDDATLLERWRGGDLVAGEALFERYYDAIERFFVNKLTDHVDDLVQETFIACVESRDRLRDGRKFRSFLFTVAHNVLYKRFRRRYRGDENAMALEQVSVFDLAPGPITVTVRSSQERLLLEALRRIPVGSQVLLELFYWEEMTGKEIAAILEIPEGTVRSRMRTARTHLERAMDRLESKPELLASTKSSLEDWARRLRERLRSADARASR